MNAPAKSALTFAAETRSAAMKALFYAAAGAAVLIAGAAEAHRAGARYNAAPGDARGPVVRSPAQTWYSATGWQGGYGPVESYGYGYGYGGAGVRPPVVVAPSQPPIQQGGYGYSGVTRSMPDRKSTRLNSSHVKISYAVFCLKKKKNTRHVRLQEHRYRLQQR